jgi:Family of unknown function (DUF6055)
MRTRPAPATAIIAAILVLACSTASPTGSPGGSALPTQPGESGAPTPAPQLEADSASKIATAEQAGTIDQDLALVYRLYAALDYSSLPAEYSSSNPAAPEATGILAELSLRRTELSPDLQAKVAPFFMRPDDPASVWAKRLAAQGDVSGLAVAAAYVAQAEADCTAGPFFACVDAVNTPIRVWYDISASGAAEEAAALAAEVDSSHMWTKEQTAMVGHTPCSDGQKGGNSRLDLYLVSTLTFAFDGRRTGLALPPEGHQPNKALGVTVPESDDACGTIAFIVLAAGQSTRTRGGLKATVAHELFHAFQFSFKNALQSWDHGWWLEATATWAEDLVYPIENSEQVYLLGYWAGVSGPEGPIDTYLYGRDPQYAAYILPFYLHQKFGSTNGSVIGQIWQASETQDPLEVIAKLDGWPDKFKEFALWNWNRDDPKLSAYLDNKSSIDTNVLYQLSACMSQADKCEKRADESYWSVLANGTHTFPVTIKYASVSYLAGRPDTDVEKLTFDLSGVRGQQGIGVQALLWIGDPDSPSELKIEDWSELAKREICINEEDVKKIVLVVSNSNTEKLFDGLVKVDARSNGCSGWRGTMSATHTWNWSGYHGTATSTFDGLWIADPTIVPSAFNPCGSPAGDDCTFYRPAGTIKWTWDSHWSEGTCDETTSGSLPAGDEEHPEQQLFVLEPVDENNLRYYGGGGVPQYRNGALVFPEIRCGTTDDYSGGPIPPNFFSLDPRSSPDNPPGDDECHHIAWQVEATAESISGSCFEYNYDYNSLFFEWDLQRVGPAPGG